MIHALKTWPVYFAEAEKGNKPFDLRKYDRPFDVGDTVILQEYDPETNSYSGKEIANTITYILSNVPKMGLKPGFCILGLKEKIKLTNGTPQP